MDLFRESRYIMHFFFTILLCWLGWLCGLAFGGQMGEAFTISANFPDIGITCIANVAAFITFLSQGKLRVEKYAEKAAVLGFSQERTHRLNRITGVKYGWSTCAEELPKCSVVILVKQTLDSSEWRSQFVSLVMMRYMSIVHDVHSILLKCTRSEDVEFPVEICTGNHEGRCGCIVFNTVEDITKMLARQIPGTLKRLSESMCLLPSLPCLINGCHGCNQGLLHVDNDILTEGEPQVDSPAAVCELLDDESIHEGHPCICIPVRSANDDEWTNQLITFLKPHDKEFRGAVIREGRTNASSALENYKNGNGECDAVEKYKFASFIVVPWFTEALISLVLTFWLKVDGFSSVTFANTAVVQKLYDLFLNLDKLYPHWFLTKTRVKSNANNTDVCQVLFPLDAVRTPFFTFVPRWMITTCSIGLVRYICCFSWIVLVALEGGANKWYHTHSMPPSTPRILVILVGICLAMVMDALDLRLCLKNRRMQGIRILVICATIGLEMLCIVVCSAIISVLGIKALGTWIYGALECLVLAKWLIGYALVRGMFLSTIGFKGLIKSQASELNWWYGSSGLYIQSSSFLLNAILAGVRAKWKF